MANEDFGKYLKSLRKAKGLTLTKLAQLSHVSHPFLSQVETGKKKISPDLLQKLAGPLDVPYLYLGAKSGHFPMDEYIEIGFLRLADDGFIREDQKSYVSRILINHGLHEINENDPVESIIHFVNSTNEPDKRFEIMVELHTYAVKNNNRTAWDDPAANDLIDTKKDTSGTSLEFILNNTTGLTYNSLPITSDDRRRISDILALLFQDRK